VLYSPVQVLDPTFFVVAVQSPDVHVIIISRLQVFCATIGSATNKARAQSAKGRDMGEWAS